MKRFLSILVAVAMTISMVLPVFAYTDTAADDHEAAIAHLSGLGVVNGYEDGSYQPDKIVTRAEMAKLLVVALKLDLGADLLTGESQFADVSVDHWAIGYINVATQYGLIKGDGDGNFRPDDTVNYAEAATMALRALNYTAVVEKAGQWPTNYLNKANELKLFDDVEGVKSSEGAKRGEVAQILWNMLNTKMWEVTQENEQNGLTSTANRKMMTVKFPDYTFVESLVYDSYTVVPKDGEYIVTLHFNEREVEIDKKAVTVTDDIRYAGNDFYKFVKGTEFEAVIFDGKEANEIVTLFVTDDNYLAEGNRYELADTYSAYTAYDAKTTYEYIRLENAKKSAKVDDRVAIDGTAGGVVTEVRETVSSTRIYIDDVAKYTISSNAKDEVFEKAMIIKDGERVTVLSLEKEDVLTKVGTSGKIDIFVVNNDVVEGSFDSVYSKTTIDEYEYVIEVAGESYDARTGKEIVKFALLETNKDGELEDGDTAEFAMEDADDNKYLGETAKFYFNAVGDLIKVVFGEVEEVAKAGNFYLITTGEPWDVADENGKVDYIQLANAEGTKSYVIADECKYTFTEDLAGDIVYVEFNDDDEIETVVNIAEISTTKVDGKDVPAYKVTTFDGSMTAGSSTPDDTTDDEYNVITADAKYLVDTVSAKYNKDNGYLDTYKVTDNTVVFTVKEILDEDDKGTGKFELIASKGAKEIEGVETYEMGVSYDEESPMIASYVFVLGEATSEERNYGIVESVISTDKDYVTVNGNKYEYTIADKKASSITAGDAIVYTIDDDEITIQLVYAKANIDGAAVVVDKDNTFVTIELDGAGVALSNEKITLDLDLIPTDQDAVISGSLKEEKFEDYKAFVLEVDFDSKNAPYFSAITEVELDEISVAKYDGVNINFDEDVIVIIKGFDYKSAMGK